MSDRTACHLFKQTRVNLDWTEKNHSSAIDIQLPPHPSRARSSLKKRGKQPDHPDTEEKFKLAHHATTASIHYRPADRFPRCIMWRVVEDSQVLSVSAVDFIKPEHHPELETTFRFVFPDQIQPGTVGFADSQSRDELVVYALTTEGVLYTLTLTPDFLQRNSFAKRGAQQSDYCTTFCPSSFMLHSPHFLLPISNDSVVIPLQDGNILKLDRNRGSTAESSDPSVASYRETTFSDTGYFGFLKNKMPWVGASTIQYGQTSVTHTTVVSAIVYDPPKDSAAKPLLFTVSVDHSLKVWSLEGDNLLRAMDLLNEPQSASMKMKTWLDPSPSHLLAIIDKPVEDTDHLFYLISFSSAATGKFKFWAATHYEGGYQEGEFKDLIDLYPEDTFNAMPPSGTAPWIISEFRVTPAHELGADWYDLWVLWKSDTNFQVQNVRFNISDAQGTWGDWTTATSDTIHIPARPTTFQESPEEVSEHWMKWIFYPGRFPDTVLESALRIYENNFLVPGGLTAKTETIQTKVSRIIGAAVQVVKTQSGEIDYGRYRNETDLQWDRFSRLCTELDKQRREALSLVSDPMSGFVWTVNVDGITALRECTETEVIRHNYIGNRGALETLSRRTDKRLGAGLEGQDLSDAMVLVSAAVELSECLDEPVLEKCIHRLQDLVVNDPMHSVGDTMWLFYEKCLEQEVPQETHEKLESLFALMDDPVKAFNSLTASLFNQPYTHTGSARLTSFGAKVLVGGTQEVIHVNYELLSQLVLLLIYIAHSESDTQQFRRVTTPEELYINLLRHFREYELLAWMSRTSAHSSGSDQDEIAASLSDLHVSGESDNTKQGVRTSVLQLVLPSNFGPARTSLSLSVCIRKFMASLDLLDATGNGVTGVASALIHANAAAPAKEFAKFLPTTHWGTYMKARTELQAGLFPQAAQDFNRAAYGMAFSPPTNDNMSPLFPHDSGAIGVGLSNYHLHVATLFDGQSPEHVVDACNLALLSTDHTTPPQLMSDILVRYFKAALQVGLYDEAYMALSRYSDEGLRHAGIRDLVTVMVEKEEGERLCGYSWVGMGEEMESALEYRAAQVVDVRRAPAYHSVLAAWRLGRGDYRGGTFIHFPYGGVKVGLRQYCCDM
ncbi:nucleoporin Nup120/160-domain-containing protein [Pyronema domesticum]|nr:nucleoporin Nup120/160-domain-containing protein [Pyronema domesticum]